MFFVQTSCSRRKLGRVEQLNKGNRHGGATHQNSKHTLSRFLLSEKNQT